MAQPIHGRDKASDQFLYLPARAGRAALQEFRRRAEGDTRFGWGIPEVDDYVIPMGPGDLACLIGRPGMGKTTAMTHMARQGNIDLQTQCPDDQSYVVYCTWETLVEEFVAIKNAYISHVTLEDIGRGKADFKRLTDSVAQSINERIAVLGMSMADDDGQSAWTRRMPTLDDVDEVLIEMAMDGRKAALLMFDYLQRIPGQPGKDRSAIVSENLERIKDMSLRHRVPSVVAVQSKRDVDDYSGLRIPGLSDAQWASSIEQTADKIFGLTIPAMYMDEGTTITVKNEGEEYAYSVGPETFCMKTIKQRWGKAGRTFVLDLQPSLGLLTDSTPLASSASEEPF